MWKYTKKNHIVNRGQLIQGNIANMLNKVSLIFSEWWNKLLELLMRWVIIAQVKNIV